MSETWLDEETSLEWAVSASEKPLTYADIDNYIEQLNDEKYAGHQDWRCPGIKELISLLDFDRAAPAIKPEAAFQDDEAYWSYTTSAKNADMVWFVDFHFGFVHFNTKENDHLVRAVRGG